MHYGSVLLQIQDVYTSQTLPPLDMYPQKNHQKDICPRSLIQSKFTLQTYIQNQLILTSDKYQTDIYTPSLRLSPCIYKVDAGNTVNRRYTLNLLDR